MLRRNPFRKSLPPGEGQGEGVKPFGDPSNQRTVNIYYPATASKLEAGRLKNLGKLGRQGLRIYLLCLRQIQRSQNPANSRFVAGTGTNAAGSDIQETVTTGTKNLPEGVTDKTTMEVRITDSLGYALMEEQGYSAAQATRKFPGKPMNTTIREGRSLQFHRRHKNIKNPGPAAALRQKHLPKAL